MNIYKGNNGLPMPLLFLLLVMCFSCKQEVISVGSLDSRLQLQVDARKGKLQYAVNFNGQALICPSELGLRSNEQNLIPKKMTRRTQSIEQKQWAPLFGKNQMIENTYHEAILETETENGLLMNVEFRVFNDGIAFRYVIPKQKNLDSLTIIEDKTTFNFAMDFICRAIDQSVETSAFSPKPLSQISFSKAPLLVQGANCWAALNEASIFDFSMMHFRNNSASTAMSVDIGVSPCSLPMKTPWRVIQIGENAGDLIESNILVNLNEPCQIEDPSWITPGKSMWDWRTHGDTINGFVYGINEASYKILIDFASENSIKYVLFDAEWYSKRGPQFSREDLNMPSVIDYARNKDVNILLYIDRRSKGGFNNWNLEEVLKTFHQWGVMGIKYGFLSGEIDDRKTFVDTTRAITRLCAKYKLLVDFHDNPVPPGGEERTWPNRIVVEYCHGQQDSRKSFSPVIAVTVPFINGLSGPLDMSNGYYDLNGLQNRDKTDKNGLNSTVVGETARCLVNYSPLLVLPDNGDEYNKKADLFRFIREMPDTWDESRVLAGEPGEYIVVARRSGKNWFVGGNTNEKARNISISLSFLGEGNYELIRYQDAKNSDYKENKEAYQIDTGMAIKDKLLDIYMAPGGGFCLQILSKNQTKRN